MANVLYIKTDFLQMSIKTQVASCMSLINIHKKSRLILNFIFFGKNLLYAN